jgi:diguanylate cyclase (GGDEF)-like protein
MFANFIDFVAAIGLFVLFFYMLFKHTSTWFHKTHIGNLALAIVWPLCQYSLTASSDRDVKVIITSVIYISLIILLHNWLLFAIRIAKYPSKPSRTIQLSLTGPALLMIALVVLGPIRNYLSSGSISDGIMIEFGALFWVFFVYGITYAVAAILIMVWKIWTTSSGTIFPYGWVLAGLIGIVAFGLADIYYNVIVYPQYGIVYGLTSIGLLIMSGCCSIIFSMSGWMRKRETTFLEAIHAQNTALIERNEQLKQLSVTDELTGCYNRRFFYEHLIREIDIEQRYKTTFSILIMDIDNFKLINDTYGHPVGDAILISLSNVIKRSLRKSDVLARIGGEEFALYLPHTAAENAALMADRLREMVMYKPFSTTKGDIPITISIGMVSAGDQAEPVADPRAYLEQLVEQADAALYKAKAEGRNRMVSAGKI